MLDGFNQDRMPIADAFHRIEYAMRPFRPGHVYFELTESFNNLSRTAIIVHIERLKDFPIVVEITDEMRSGDVPIVIGQQVAQHFAGIHKPVDDHIQLGEE